MTALRLDTGDPTPPYEQIRRQIALLVDAGELEPDQRLPTVRQLAADLRVAPGTVARAFKELEASGYVQTRRGAGTRVLARQPQRVPAALMLLAQRFVDEARRAGATGADILAATQDALQRRDHDPAQ